MLTTHSLTGGESETLQSFVLRRLTEDEPSMREKIYDLVMEFHSEQRASNTILLNNRERRVSFAEHNLGELIHGASAVNRRVRTSGLEAKSGFQFLVLVIHAIMLEEGWPAAMEVNDSRTGFRPERIVPSTDVFLPAGWDANPNVTNLVYNFESVSLHFQCEHVGEEIAVSACKMCDNFCGPTICVHLRVDRFVKKSSLSQGFTLLDEQAEQNLHAEITALVLRIFPEMDDTVVHTAPTIKQQPAHPTHKRKTCHSSESRDIITATPLRLPPLPPMSPSPLDASQPGSVCGSLHDISSLSSREKDDTLPDFAPLTRSKGPRPKLPSFQEMFECSGGGECPSKQMRHELPRECASMASSEAHVSTPARVSSGSWAGMDYDYSLHGANFYDSLSDNSSY